MLSPAAHTHNSPMHHRQLPSLRHHHQSLSCMSSLPPELMAPGLPPYLQCYAPRRLQRNHAPDPALRHSTLVATPTHLTGPRL